MRYKKKKKDLLFGFMKMGWDVMSEAAFEVGDSLLLESVKKGSQSSTALWSLFEGIAGEHHLGATLGPGADVEKNILAGIGAGLFADNLAIGFWAAGHEPLEGHANKILGLGGDDTVKPSHKVLWLTRQPVGINHHKVLVERGLGEIHNIRGEVAGSLVFGHYLTKRQTWAVEVWVVFQDMSYYKMQINQYDVHT